MGIVLQGKDGEPFDEPTSLEVPIILSREDFKKLISELQAVNDEISDDDNVIIQTMKFDVKLIREDY